MRYIILSVTGFSSSRREVGVFYHFKSRLYFFCLLESCLSRKLCLQPPQCSILNRDLPQK